MTERMERLSRWLGTMLKKLGVPEAYGAKLLQFLGFCLVGVSNTLISYVVNLLECVRTSGEEVRSVVIVTTDKVYRNREWPWGYRETDPLDGFDPYSNSKSCAELVTHSYVNSFFSGAYPAVSTARAGNVIGGGDFASDRIIPDCVRAAMRGEEIILRNPNSTRPYQHVLEQRIF